MKAKCSMIIGVVAATLALLGFGTQSVGSSAVSTTAQHTLAAAISSQGGPCGKVCWTAGGPVG
jgi:hypothetical protein